MSPVSGRSHTNSRVRATCAQEGGRADGEVRCGVEKYGAEMSAKTGRTVQTAQIHMETAATVDET
ncbi:hypothetical protein NY08_4529 [Rhodococcus sp. B7740]|nr:hypothetical protein NY08_4529 [Rhodococcus sp. B7740]